VRKLKLAVVQPALAEGECAANWRAAKAALARAGAAGADLVVLPEMWLTGYAYRRLDELARSPRVARAGRALARKHGYFVRRQLGRARRGRPPRQHRLHRGPRRERARALPQGPPLRPDEGGPALRRRPPRLRREARDRHRRPRALLRPALPGAGAQDGAPGRRAAALPGAVAAGAARPLPHAAGGARDREPALHRRREPRRAQRRDPVRRRLDGRRPARDLLAQLGDDEGFAEVEIDLDEVAASREQVTYLADRAREVDEFLYR